MCRCCECRTEVDGDFYEVPVGVLVHSMIVAPSVVTYCANCADKKRNWDGLEQGKDKPGAKCYICGHEFNYGDSEYEGEWLYEVGEGYVCVSCMDSCRKDYPAEWED